MYIQIGQVPKRNAAVYVIDTYGLSESSQQEIDHALGLFGNLVIFTS